jgi:hypothetical protein
VKQKVMKSSEMLELLMLMITKTHSSKNALQLKICERKKKEHHQAFRTSSFFYNDCLNFHSLHFYAFEAIADLPFVVLVFLTLELLAMKLHN